MTGGISAFTLLSSDLSSSFSLRVKPPIEGEMRSREEPMLVAADRSLTLEERSDHPAIAIIKLRKKSKKLLEKLKENYFLASI